MSLIRKAVQTALNHATSIRRNKRRITDLVEDVRLLKAALARRRQIGSPQHMPYEGSELVCLIMTEEVTFNPPRWNAIRLQRKDDGTKWEPDEEDDIPYRVMPMPGMRGAFFPGCRCLCAFSHIEEYLGEDPDGLGPEVAPTLERGVYIPVAGECFGFLASITGSELVGGGTNEDSRQYQWSQVGLDAADTYTDESDPLGEGELGLAIHQQQAWMGLEDGVQLDRRSLTGHVVQMWYSGGAFRFSSPRERFSVLCEEPA